MEVLIAGFMQYVVDAVLERITFGKAEQKHPRHKDLHDK